jgi:hypothetical protein
MEYFNGLPIDTGRLTTEIVMGCFAVLFVVFALFSGLYDLKKRIRIYREVCNEPLKIEPNSDKYEKKLRKANRRKQESKKKAGAKLFTEACTVLFAIFVLCVVARHPINAIVDYVYDDYCDVVSEYEIVKKRRRDRVVLEDGTRLKYDYGMVERDRNDHGKGRFIYSKRSNVIVGFEKIE